MLLRGHAKSHEQFSRHVGTPFKKWCLTKFLDKWLGVFRGRLGWVLEGFSMKPLTNFPGNSGREIIGPGIHPACDNRLCIIWVVSSKLGWFQPQKNPTLLAIPHFGFGFFVFLRLNPPPPPPPPLLDRNLTDVPELLTKYTPVIILGQSHSCCICVKYDNNKGIPITQLSFTLMLSACEPSPDCDCLTW